MAADRSADFLWYGENLFAHSLVILTQKDLEGR
jgi:hypothetical protein